MRSAVPAWPFGLLAVGAVTAGGGAAGAEVVVWEQAEGGNGHGYEAVAAPGGITWTDAAAAAEALGGHLATLTSPEESAFVFGAVGSAPSLWRPTGNGSDHVGPWIGLVQDTASPDYAEPGGGWGWITGEPLAWTDWRVGEPNNAFGTEHFGVLFSGTATPAAAWNDYPVDDPRFDRPTSFIVEYPVVVPGPGGGDRAGGSALDQSPGRVR